LEYIINLKNKFVPNFAKNHLIVLLFFSIITLIIFPVLLHIFDPAVFPVSGSDGYSHLSGIWNYKHYALDLGKTPFIDGPVGVSPYNYLLGIPLQMIFNTIDTFKILLFSSVILNGYCFFHLSKYLTRNYPASLLGGIIFAFSSYVTFHFWGHESLITLYWVPVFILFLLKMKDTNKIKYSIITGISFSLIFLSQWYTFFFTVLFIAIFIPYLVITSKTKKKFLFLLIISVIVSIPIIIPFSYFALYETVVEEPPEHLYFKRQEFIIYGHDLLNYVTGNPSSPFNKITGNPLIAQEGFDRLGKLSFLGFTGLFFCILAIFKVDKKYTLPWILGGGFLMLVSLGPFLKLNNFVTEIPLPWYLLREIPGAEIFRILGRAHIMYFFAFSILASYGFTYLFSRKWISKKILIILFIGILSFLIFELYPIPDMGETLPEISAFYYDMADDPRDVHVLNVPRLGDAGSSRGTSPSKYFLYYQTIHQKSMVADTTKLRDYKLFSSDFGQYFLKKFHEQGFKGDVVNQDLSEVGTSLFNYFDVGYVIVHKVPHSEKITEIERTMYAEEMRNILGNIFHREPDFEDSRLFAYKVAESNSTTPYIVLNKQWSLLEERPDILYREIESGSYLTIVNPTDEIQEVRIQMGIFSLSGSKELYFDFNNVQSSNFTLPSEKFSRFESEILALQPGDNIITINFDETLDQSNEFNDIPSNLIGISSISFGFDDISKEITPDNNIALGDIIIVSDKSGCDSQGAIIRVDAIWGEQTLISDNCISDEGFFDKLEEVLIIPNGDFMVLDKESGCDGNGALIQVNPISGKQSIFSDNCVSFVDLFNDLEDFTIDSSGNFILVDKKSGCNFEGAVIRVDGDTGEHLLISDNCTDGKVIFSADLEGVAIHNNGDIIVVGNKGKEYGCFDVPGQGYVLKVDAVTGIKELISDNCISTFPLFNNINDILIDSNGDIIIVDEDAGNDGKGALIRVNPGTGEQTIISENENSKNDLYDDIEDAAIDSEGNFIVLDKDMECFLQKEVSGVIIVDSLGEQNVLSNNCISSKELFSDPEGLTIWHDET